jgi:hypothetical protein
VGRQRDASSRAAASAELDDLRPYLDLAREIRAEVERLAADDATDGDALARAFEEIPRRERVQVARDVFARLPAERQWELLAALYGDDDLRAFLAEEHAARLAVLRRNEAWRPVVRAARLEHRLDTTTLPPGAPLTLGLFRSVDTRPALVRGQRSDTCARQLVLRATAVPGELHVLDDVFNPRGGLFVTGEYDERVWREDRLPGHAIVRVGAITDRGTGAQLEPTVYPGARVDFEVAGRLIEGRLHVGFVVLGDDDLFADGS